MFSLQPSSTAHQSQATQRSRRILLKFASLSCIVALLGLAFFVIPWDDGVDKHALQSHPSHMSSSSSSSSDSVTQASTSSYPLIRAVMSVPKIFIAIAIIVVALLVVGLVVGLTTSAEQNVLDTPNADCIMPSGGQERQRSSGIEKEQEQTQDEEQGSWWKIIASVIALFACSAVVYSGIYKYRTPKPLPTLKSLPANATDESSEPLPSAKLDEPSPSAKLVEPSPPAESSEPSPPAELDEPSLSAEFVEPSPPAELVEPLPAESSELSPPAETPKPPPSDEPSKPSHSGKRSKKLAKIKRQIRALNQKIYHESLSKKVESKKMILFTVSNPYHRTRDPVRGLYASTVPEFFAQVFKGVSIGGFLPHRGKDWYIRLSKDVDYDNLKNGLWSIKLDTLDNFFKTASLEDLMAYRRLLKKVSRDIKKLPKE